MFPRCAVECVLDRTSTRGSFPRVRFARILIVIATHRSPELRPL